MRKLIFMGFYILFTVLFNLRYKFIRKGLDTLPVPKDSGTLFLSSHPSLLDGIMLVYILWPKYNAVPLVVQDYYSHHLVHRFFKLLRSIPVPNFSVGSGDFKEEELQKSIDSVGKLLMEGKNVYLFPSSRIRWMNKDDLEGTSYVHRLLQKYPVKNIALVRIRGLWGSMFSYAYRWKYPNFFGGWGEKFAIVLKNLIFFVPKRKVVFEFKKANDFPFNKGVLEMNQYVEEFLNSPSEEGETPVSVPYYFYQKNPPPLKPSPSHQHFEYSFPFEKKFLKELSELLNVPETSLTKQTEFGKDLGLDSLDILRLTFYFEKHYDLGLTNIEEILTVGDLEGWVAKKIPHLPPPFLPIPVSDVSKFYQNEENNRSLGFKEKASILSAFESKVKEMPLKIAGADIWNEGITYQEMGQEVNIYAETLKKIPHSSIGIMLPHTIDTLIMTLAILKAGKTPILFDWLAPKKYKQELHNYTRQLPIFTSKTFLSMLNQVDLNGLYAGCFTIDPDKETLRDASSYKKIYENGSPDHPYKNIDGKNLPSFVYYALNSDEMIPDAFSQNKVFELKKALGAFPLNGNDVVMRISYSNSPLDLLMPLFFLLYGVRIVLIPAYRMSREDLNQAIVRWNPTCLSAPEEILKGLTFPNSVKQILSDSALENSKQNSNQTRHYSLMN